MSRRVSHPLLIVSVAAFAAASPLPLHAAQAYESCTGFIDQLPAVIGTQGVWCLRKDLNIGIVTGHAIEITTNNVTIDCNHFKVGGQKAGVGTSANGIYANGRTNIVVRHCNVRGFYAGVNLSGSDGGGHLVEDNRFDSNTRIGLSVQGDGSTVRRNLVRSTGGSTSFPGGAVAIAANRSVDVLDNTVDTVVPLADTNGNASAYGVATYHVQDGSISGNRIRGLVPVNFGTAVGINAQESYRIILAGNHMTHEGGAGIGLRCYPYEVYGTKAQAKDNIVSGFATAIEGCNGTDNEVVP